MRAFGFLASLGAAAVLTAACSGEASTDREPTVTELAILDQLAAPKDDLVSAEVEVAREAFVTQCMDAEGLDYLGPPEAPSLIEWLGLTQEEFQAEYGFGHATTIDLAMAYETFANAVLEEYQASFTTLSDAERRQYRTAEGECLMESYAEFGFPENGTVFLPNDSPINGYTERAYEATADDPRLAEVTADWSACMREQGYDFADRDDMGLPLQQEAEPFAMAYATQGQPLVDGGSTWEELRAADVLDSDQLAELADLQQRELAIAAAHQHCIDKGYDVEATYSELYEEHLTQIAGS